MAWTLTLIKNEVGFIRIANTDCMPPIVLRGTIIKKVATIVRTTTEQVTLLDLTRHIQLGHELSSEEKLQFKGLVTKYSHPFLTKTGLIRHTNVAEHEINTEETGPVWQNPYWNPPYCRACMAK